jgi:hypothetical protein
MIGKGVLTLLEPEDALTEIARPENQSRLQARAERMAEQGLTDIGGLDPQKASAVEHKAAPDTFSVDYVPESERNPRIMVLVEGVNSTETSTQEALDELANLADQLTVDDLTYIIDQCRDGKFTSAAQKMLADLRASEAQQQPPQ